MRKTNPNPTEDDKLRISKWLTGETCSGKELYREIHRLASRREHEDCGWLGILHATPYAPEKLAYPKECFSTAVEMDFEGFKVRVPCGWEKILKICYGDW
jgi:phosphorylcholine metabolism protein LicD